MCTHEKGRKKEKIHTSLMCWYILGIPSSGKAGTGGLSQVTADRHELHGVLNKSQEDG